MHADTLQREVFMSGISQEQIESLFTSRPRNEWLMKWLIACASYLSLITVSSILIMLIFGETFDPILRKIGIKGVYVRIGGIYADCSQKENRESPFCQPKITKANKDWKSLGDSGGRTTTFQLSKDY